jgi:Tat protein translocase TatB subunit
MFGINPFELMIILMVGLIVVGPKRLPEIGRTVGRAFSELRRVQEEIRDTVRFDLDDEEDLEPPSFPAHRERAPDEPPGPTAVELASAAAREREAADGAPDDARATTDDDAPAPTREPDSADELPELRSEEIVDDGDDAAAPGSNGSAKRPARDEAG